MNRIKILPPHVASQIAAGEVIEHPASVVKELVENAVDARASRITIETEGGGIRLIRVTDNGEGMSRDDLVLSVKPHATSKIEKADDLLRISTMGFRGEALASIASVSRLTITSRSETETGGWRLRVEFGREMGVELVGCPKGTSVTVQDLFETLPARRKFLKKGGTEQARINLTARLMAAAHSHVKLELLADGKRVFHALPRTGQERLIPLLGKGIVERLIPIRASGPEISLEGFISSKEGAKPSPKHFHLFLNNRPIKSSMVWKAVMEACQGILMRGTYPAGALFLEIAPEKIDMNVHPSKQEVRFLDGALLFRLVYHSVRNGLEKGLYRIPQGPPSEELAPTPLPQGSYPAPWLELREPSTEGEAPPAPNRSLQERVEDSPSLESQPVIPAKEADQPEREEVHPLAGARALGQLNRSYIVAEGPQGLFIVDQHACHEAILFNRLQKELEGKREMVKQPLAVPLTVDLEEWDIHGTLPPLRELEALGFEIESFGGSHILIRAVPEALLTTSGDVADTIEVIKSLFIQGGGSAEPFRVLTAALACKGAVKANQPLSRQEMDSLIHQAVDEGVHSCPHGRPILFHLPLNRIEKLLGRSK